MYLIERLKYPMVYKKQVNINDLTVEEKTIYIKRIINENMDIDILGEIVISLPEQMQISCLLYIISYARNRELTQTIVKNIANKYLNIDIIKNIILIIDTPFYHKIRIELFKSICDKLSHDELYYFINNIGYHSAIKPLVEKKVNIDFLFTDKNTNRNMLELYLMELDINERFNFILKNLHLFDNSMSLLCKLNKEDRMYIEILLDRHPYPEKEDVLKSFIIKFYKDIIDKKIVISESFFGLVSDYDNFFDSLDVPEEVKTTILSGFKRPKSREKYNFLINISDVEFINYFEGLNDEELREVSFISYIYNNRISLLPLDIQDKLVKYNNEILRYVSYEYVIMHKDELPIDKLLYIYSFPLEDLYELYEFNSEEACDKFIDAISNRGISTKLYELLEKVAAKVLEFNPNYKKAFGHLDYHIIIDKYPTILKIYSSIYILNEDIPILYEYFKNDKDFLFVKISNYNDLDADDEIAKRDLFKYVELASIDEINKLYYFYLEKLASYFINGEMPLSLFEKFYLTKAIEYIEVTDSNESSIVELLNKIDNTGGLLSLYKELTPNAAKQAMKNGVEDVYLTSVQTRFIQNALVIKNNFNKIIELYKDNPNLLFSFNFKLLNILDFDDIVFYSKYSDLNKINIDKLIINKDKIREYIMYIKENTDNSKEYIYEILCLFSKLDLEKQEAYFNKFNISDTLYFMHGKSLYHKKIEIYIDMLLDKNKIQEIDYSKMSKFELLDTICKNMLYITYYELLEFYNEFCIDIDELLNSNPDISKQELEIIKRIHIIKQLSEIDDIDTLRTEYLSKYQTLDRIDYIYNIKLEESLRRLYTKEKVEKLYIPRDNDLIRKVNGVKIYELPHRFNLLLSVIGAYVKSSSLSDNAYEEWNDKGKNINQNICTSLINETNLSYARRKGSVIFGFYNINDDEIVREAPYDIASDSNGTKVFTHEKCQCRTLKNLIDNTRLGHNELLLKRNVSNGKRQPDYIIALNKATSKDIKVAKQFGIPIVIINTKKIIKDNITRIKDLMSKLESNFDPNKLKELIILYNNNYTGFITLSILTIVKYKKLINLELFLKRYSKKIIKTNNEEYIIQFINILKEEKLKYESVHEFFIPYDFASIIKYLENALVTKSSLSSDVKTKTK